MVMEKYFTDENVKSRTCAAPPTLKKNLDLKLFTYLREN